MNLKSELQKMNTTDLKSICRELGIKYPSSRSDIIKRLLKPLKQTYNLNWFGQRHLKLKKRRNARLMLQKNARGYLARKKYKPIWTSNLKYKSAEKSRCEKRCKNSNYRYAHMKPHDCQQKCQELYTLT